MSNQTLGILSPNTNKRSSVSFRKRKQENFPIHASIGGASSSASANLNAGLSKTSLSPVSSKVKTIRSAVGNSGITRTSLSGAPLEKASATKSKSVFFVCHFLNISNPTSEEVIFLLCARAFGFITAVWLAEKFQWKCQRPSQALYEMMYGHGRAYAKKKCKTRKISLDMLIPLMQSFHYEQTKQRKANANHRRTSGR